MLYDLVTNSFELFGMSAVLVFSVVSLFHMVLLVFLIQFLSEGWFGKYLGEHCGHHCER